MSDTAFRESTTPLLRPDQVAEMQDEHQRLDTILHAPPYQTTGVDRGNIARQARRLRSQLEAQAPRPYDPKVKDAAIAREKELEEQIKVGMPTRAEMRRNPLGAMDKNESWTGRTKALIPEWKNIRRRRFIAGDLDAETGEANHANIEMLRPVGGSHELNMDGEQIPGKIFHNLATVGPAVVMNDEREEELYRLNPDIHNKMAVLGSSARTRVLALVDKEIANKKNRVANAHRARETIEKNRNKARIAKKIAKAANG